MAAAAFEISSPVGVIAGGGAMPFAVADSLKARGLDPVLFALRGACDPLAAERFRHHWIAVGEVRTDDEAASRRGNCKDPDLHRNAGATGAVGNPARLGNASRMGRIWSAFRGGDDHLLSGVGRIFEQDGFRLLGLKEVAPDLLMPEGCVTRRLRRSRCDVRYCQGTRCAQRARFLSTSARPSSSSTAMSSASRASKARTNCCSVSQNLRVGGRIRAAAGRGVLVKAPKSGQDLRFDLPTIGPRTLKERGVRRPRGRRGRLPATPWLPIHRP